MANGHAVILQEYLRELANGHIERILDAGSGRTSLSMITSCFSNATIGAVVYPGDERKLRSITPLLSEHICAVEIDISKCGFENSYDLVVAHLLLGEATKFGNTFHSVFEKLMKINSRYFIIIDYLEDPSVDEGEIRALCQKTPFKMIKYLCLENQNPQVWDDFTGTHNFGYLIEKR